jgi:hypothetical protein
MTSCLFSELTGNLSSLSAPKLSCYNTVFSVSLLVCIMPQTAFVSTETFTQDEFEEWLSELSPSDANHYELLNGRYGIPLIFRGGETLTSIVLPQLQLPVSHVCV